MVKIRTNVDYYDDFNCMNSCTEPQCLREMELTEESVKPYFDKIMSDIYNSKNFEELNVSEMPNDEYRLSLNFTCADMFAAMGQVAKFFKNDKIKNK